MIILLACAGVNNWLLRKDPGLAGMLATFLIYSGIYIQASELWGPRSPILLVRHTKDNWWQTTLFAYTAHACLLHP